MVVSRSMSCTVGCPAPYCILTGVEVDVLHVVGPAAVEDAHLDPHRVHTHTHTCTHTHARTHARTHAHTHTTGGRGGGLPHRRDPCPPPAGGAGGAGRLERRHRHGGGRLPRHGPSPPQDPPPPPFSPPLLPHLSAVTGRPCRLLVRAPSHGPPSPMLGLVSSPGSSIERLASRQAKSLGQVGPLLRALAHQRGTGGGGWLEARSVRGG